MAKVRPVTILLTNRVLPSGEKHAPASSDVVSSIPGHLIVTPFRCEAHKVLNAFTVFTDEQVSPGSCSHLIRVLDYRFLIGLTDELKSPGLLFFPRGAFPGAGCVEPYLTKTFFPTCGRDEVDPLTEQADSFSSCKERCSIPDSPIAEVVMRGICLSQIYPHNSEFFEGFNCSGIPVPGIAFRTIP